ncbi:DNA-binding MarR family transcriptional regulator [Psychrobacillus insolitus]|uniref:HTH-type transcriptional regulator MgrA n=1 Tax=Psychrobacillus insolitus TaxID=1461 RepID=A0A2W7PBJ7_9BACI|nr:MarR family transcriptional regulator [Psychrobacillus insolitus]PZX03988.1 DNA-binding MarR family transcriptional regulator [Psychrobacillus insolitus]
MNTPSKLDQQLCFEVYKASSNFAKIYARTLEPFQLTFTQYLVLLTLWDEDHLLAKDIGNRLELGIGTLNPIITRMIDRGWLDKRQSEIDKRSFIISLTEKAKNEEKLIEKAIIQKVINCNFLELNAETLMSNLKDLNSFLGQID